MAKFLDLFSGIGGFRLGMEMAGHECVGHVEIDKYANISYQAIHEPKEGEFYGEDITAVTDESLHRLRDRNIEVICGGFPCQAFSIAGKRKGFEDTRGTLFFEIARFASVLRPRYLFLENVKGLLNHENGDTFETILAALDELGYDAEWEVLNSKHFGVPQNRERVFIIGHLRNGGTRKVFPIGEQSKVADGSGRLTVNTITTRTGGAEAVGTYVVESEQLSELKQVAKLDIINLEQPNSETRRSRVGKGVAQTITTSPQQATLQGMRIRKLTSRECWRLQGFPDWAYDRAAKVVSESQLYKQAGNSVTVNVIYEIAKKLR
jgi:DNA (cytosine-5)-methyltransferase 1